MTEPATSRRRFLEGSAAAGAAAALNLAPFSTARAAGKDEIRIGLVGCGGRGGGAASQALSADPGVRLVALGDTFADQVENTHRNLKRNGDLGARVDVPPDRRFVGFDAYKKVIDSVDVVLLATSPYFRPMHLKYAVEKGVHAFVEKPVATDPAGLRDIMATCEVAKTKKLSIVSGLCYRYDNAKRETLARVHDGQIGEIKAMETFYQVGGLWNKGRKDGWSDMEWQIRNWLYFTWLSGDHITEQHIHSLDKIAWAMQDQTPVRCTGSGGRISRTEAKWGNIYDHFHVVYEYPGDIKAHSACRQISGCTNKVSDHVYGTLGNAHLQSHRIAGKNEWRFRGKKNNMYQTEHNELFASIRAGKPLNNGDYMCKSTLMAIMGRMSAYTGQSITWEQALNSKLDLAPPQFAWGSVPVRPVARPGQTKFV